MARDRGLAGGLHRIVVLRVGHVVREVAVWRRRSGSHDPHKSAAVSVAGGARGRARLQHTPGSKNWLPVVSAPSGWRTLGTKNPPAPLPASTMMWKPASGVLCGRGCARKAHTRPLSSAAAGPAPGSDPRGCAITPVLVARRGADGLDQVSGVRVHERHWLQLRLERGQGVDRERLRVAAVGARRSDRVRALSGRSPARERAGRGAVPLPAGTRRGGRP